MNFFVNSMPVSSQGISDQWSYFMMSAVPKYLAENIGTQNCPSVSFSLLQWRQWFLSWDLPGIAWSRHTLAIILKAALQSLLLCRSGCRIHLFAGVCSLYRMTPLPFCGKAHQELNSLSLSCWRRAWTRSVSHNVVGRSSFCKHVSISLGKSRQVLTWLLWDLC